MSTRSNSSHLFSPIQDPESLIRRRNLGEPSSLFNFEKVMNNNHNQEPPPQNNNGPPPMVRPNGQAPRTMEELCQPSINGQGGPITPILIQATDFGLRHHMIQQNGVSDDALRLSLFLYSLTHHAIAWYDRLLRNSIHSFDDIIRKFISKYFPPSMVTKLRNEITKFEQKSHESLFEAWECYKLLIDRCPNHNMLLVTQIDTFYNGLPLSHHDTVNAATGGTLCKRHRRMLQTDQEYDCSPQPLGHFKMMRQFQTFKVVDTKSETCGGPYSSIECPAVGGYTQESAYATTGNHNSGGNSYQPQGDRNLLSYRTNNYLGPPFQALRMIFLSLLRMIANLDKSKQTIRETLTKKNINYAESNLYCEEEQ
uniref:Retrotransposon gag domain-containing protein n=1 Tax=Tanacetum cinerariifolium TaxID=118510 RepID=A0A699HYC1_TANCI|nr:hypothetical protein [Tanacetum cinerariifolium]